MWITALFNSMKLWVMLCRATQDGRIMVESSDKTLSTGKGNGKLLQHSCLENHMNSMKRQNTWHWKMNSPCCFVPNILLEKVGEIAPEEWRGWAKLKQNPVVDLSVGESTVQWCKEQYCIGTWNIRSMNHINWEWSNRRWQEWTLTF